MSKEEVKKLFQLCSMAIVKNIKMCFVSLNLG